MARILSVEEHRNRLHDFLKQGARYRREVNEKLAGYRPSEHQSGEEYVLRYGRFFEAQSLPRRYKPGRGKACYYNAYMLATEHAELTYTEGYVSTSHGVPVKHAWCIDRHSRVIDNTLKQPERCGYFGLTVPLAVLTAVALERGNHIGSFMDAVVFERLHPGRW